MVQKIKTLILSLSLVFAFAAPVALPAIASATAAAGADVQNSVCTGANTLQIDQTTQTCATATGDQTTTVNSLLTKIINIFSVIVGVVAVVMIIVGGFRYITSGGKDEGVKTAKNTILYALIGLVVVALAQIIVKFVLNKATQ